MRVGGETQYPERARPVVRGAWCALRRIQSCLSAKVSRLSVRAAAEERFYRTGGRYSCCEDQRGIAIRIARLDRCSPTQQRFYRIRTIVDGGAHQG